MRAACPRAFTSMPSAGTSARSGCSPLPVVADAVWNDAAPRDPLRQLEGSGRSPHRAAGPRDEVRRVVPGGRGRQESTPRTYKLSNILTLEAGGTFTRPRGFDLATYWNESIARFETGLYRGTATLRAPAKGLKRLRYLSAAVAEAVDRARARPDARGWIRLTIPIESVDMAAERPAAYRRGMRGPAPAELRKRIAEAAVRITALYR